MPQMMPLNWIFFFFFFNFMYMLFMVIYFYNFIPLINIKTNNLNYDNKSILNFWPLY
uniref:ATP synthase F0 subunit 8 n=1 Tax=Micrasema sp. XG-2021 TaxID=2996737 RepID=A0A9E8RUL5_9NEOP|nr:ATP synthase F0 subunit 8 [Micrasema sp. XG-2021]